MTLVMTLNSLSLFCATAVINLKKRGDTKPCPEPPAKLLALSRALARPTCTQKLQFRDFYATCRDEERYLRKVSMHSPSMDFMALYNAQQSGVSIKDVLTGGNQLIDPLSTRRTAAVGVAGGSSSPTNTANCSSSTSQTHTLELPTLLVARRPSSAEQSQSSRKLMATRNRKLEWYFIAQVCDKLLFGLFSILLCVTVLTSLVIVPEMNDHE